MLVLLADLDLASRLVRPAARYGPLVALTPLVTLEELCRDVIRLSCDSSSFVSGSTVIDAGAMMSKRQCQAQFFRRTYTTMPFVAPFFFISLNIRVLW